MICLAAGPAGAQEPDAAVFAQIRSIALAASPEVQAARAAVATSEAWLAAAGFGSPAVLSAEVEEVPDGYRIDDAASAKLVLEKTFLPPGQAAAARAVMQAELAAARARVTAAERRVAARIDAAVIRAVGWAALAGRLVEQDSLLSSAESSLTARFGVGQTSYVDVLRVRTERLRVQTALSEAVAESRAARRAIEGILPPVDTVARPALLQVDELVKRTPVRVLLAELPAPPDIDSLMSAAAAVGLAEAEVRQARARRDLLLSLQRPQLGGYVGAERFEDDDGSKRVGPVLGISVSLPFTVGKSNRASRAAAELEIAAAEASLEATRALLRADLLAARERYEAALARLSVFDAALLRAARLEREAALGAYRSEQLSLTELLDFERGLYAAESERIQSGLAAAEALADLVTAAYATGEPSAPPEASAGARPGGV